MPGLGTRLRAALAALAVWLAPHPGAAAADGAAPALTSITPDSSTFYQLRAGELILGDALGGARIGTADCLDLAGLAALLEFQISVHTATASAQGWFFTETQQFVLAGHQGRVGIAGTGSTLPAGSMAPAEDGLCVQVSELERWFGLTLTVDHGNAIVFVRASQPLPVELRMARARRHAELLGRSQAPAAAAEQPVTPPYAPARWPSLDASLTLQASRRHGGRALEGRYDITAVGELLYASHEVLLQSDTLGTPALLRWQIYRRSPEGGAVGRLGLTEVALGDIALGGADLVSRGATGRGATLSNMPLTTPDELNRTTLRGDLPAGWEAELYRDNRLLAFQRGGDDGRYTFADVPVLLGENRFRIELYGPQGQRRTIMRPIVADADTLPVGRLQYRVGIVQQDVDFIPVRGQGQDLFGTQDWRWDVALRYGLLEGLSLQGAVHRFAREGRSHSYATAGLSTALLGRPLAVQLARGASGEAVQVSLTDQIGGLAIAARGLQSFGGFESERVAAGVRRRGQLDLDTAVPLGRSLSLPITVRAEVEQHRIRGVQALISQQAGLSVGRQFLANSLSAQIDRRLAGGVRLDGAALANLRLGDHAARLQAVYAVLPQLRLRSVQTGIDFGTGRGDPSAFQRLTLGWNLDDQIGSAGLGLSRTLHRMRWGVQASADTRGRLRASVSLLLSLHRPDPGGPWLRQAERSARMGALAARVFEDVDNDGLFSALDRIIPSAGVRVNGQVPSHSAAAGDSVFVSNLAADARARVNVDYRSLDNPNLVPGRPLPNVLLRPGPAARIDLPMVTSGEIEGVAERLRGSQPVPVAGATIALVTPAGAVVAVETSQFDGFFLFSAVRTGRYRLVVVPAGVVPGQGQPLPVDAHAPVVEISQAEPYPPLVTLRVPAPGP